MTSSTHQQQQQQSLSTFTELIIEHLADLADVRPNWQLSEVTVSGRGLTATRDLAEGEEIFRERALLSGPIGLRSASSGKLICSICYHQFEEQDTESSLEICKNGCSLPVCQTCSGSADHVRECELYRNWQPKDPTIAQNHSLRILAFVRSFFLDENGKQILQMMQSNPDRFFQKEIERAANCFHRPFYSFLSTGDVDDSKDVHHNLKETLKFLGRTICVFNTNAFESRSKLDGEEDEVTIKALFPLAGLMNHQCVPNTTHSFENGNVIVVCAARSILAGEELFTSYTPTLWSNLARKAFLLLTKQFQCECDRCLDNTVRIILPLFILSRHHIP